MDTKKLERYAFYWLIALLGFSAVALLLGGRPLVTLIFGYSSSAVYSLLDLSWVVCGVAAGYLAYQWVQHKKQVFGGGEMKDQVAFWFMLLCGFNLGICGVLGNNLFLDIFMGRAVLLAAGVLCVVVAVYLWQRWQHNGEQLFSAAAVTPKEEDAEKESSPSVDGSPTEAEE